MNLDNIPEDAPPELKAMAENVSDILAPILKWKGEAYHTRLILLMAMHSQLRELEVLACESCQVVGGIAEKMEDESLSRAAISNHGLSHMYAESIKRHLDIVLSLFQDDPKMHGMEIDLKTLLTRIDADWYKKGH